MTYMGGATSFNKKFQTITTLFPITSTAIITTLILIITPSIVDGSTLSFTTFKHDAATTSSSQHHLSNNLEPPPFRPSTGVLVGVLSAAFTLFFLILLYVKHCIRGANNNTNSRILQRKNSGIDRSVLELLPSFKFSSLKGEKDGLECSVCLARFEDPEVLRLLPKCKHAFHVECLDTWLDVHSTCPLCRWKVDPSDVIMEDDNEDEKSSNGESDIERGINDDVSSGGREGDDVRTTLWSTKSLDGAEHRLKHRIIVSPAYSGSQDGVHQRWSDFQSRDVFYLTPDMITWKARGGRGRKSHNTNINDANIGVKMKNHRGTNHWRSVSEATGMRNV